MREETMLQKLKHIIYKLILPLYLWTVDYKTLDDYVADMFFMETGGFPEWYKREKSLPRVKIEVICK